MKHKKIVIAILLMLIVIILVLGVIIYKQKNSLILKQTVFTFELGNKISSEPKDYLKENSSQTVLKESRIVFKGKEKIKVDKKIKSSGLNYLNVGTYEFNIIYKKKVVSFKIKIIDTTKPKFIDFKDEIILEQNALNVELKNFYKAEDLSPVTISINGDYDINKVGEYKVKVSAIDEYKNQTTQESKIKVIAAEDVNDNTLTATVDGQIYRSKKTVESKSKQNDSYNKSDKSQQQNYTKSNYNNNYNQSSSLTSVPRYRTDISNGFANQINSYRKANGLSELPITAEAQNEANNRAKQLVNNYSHNSSYGFGENIGRGSIGVNFVEAWKKSHIHNSAILREQNVAMAVSVYEANNKWYVVASFKMNY